MPWHVAKSSSCPSSKPWAVIKDADSSVVACHPSKEKAMAHMRALYANEPSAIWVAEQDASPPGLSCVPVADWFTVKDVLDIAYTLRNFDPAEKRDKNGKWTKSGGALHHLLEPIAGTRDDAVSDVDDALALIPDSLQEKIAGQVTSFKVGPSPKVYNDIPGLERSSGVQLKNVLGLFDPNTGYMLLNGNPQDRPTFKATVVHEAMHALDKRLYASQNPNAANSFFLKYRRIVESVPTGKVDGHYDPNVEGRRNATAEGWAELAAEYLMGRPFNLGSVTQKDKAALVRKDIAEWLDAYFLKVLGVERGSG